MSRSDLHMNSLLYSPSVCIDASHHRASRQNAALSIERFVASRNSTLRKAMATGNGDDMRCQECNGILSCACCASGQQSSETCWLTIALVDLTGARQTIGPLHHSTLCLVVRDAAAWWKQVNRSTANVIHGIRPLRDGETLRSSGIRDGDNVTMVVSTEEVWEHQNATPILSLHTRHAYIAPVTNVEN